MRKSDFAKRALKEWIDILHLSDYTIKMSLWDTLDPDEQSSGDVTNGSHKTATIIISLAQSVQDIEWSIAHELMHIVTDPTWRQFQGSVLDIRSKRAQTKMLNIYNLTENEVVERFLRIIYHHLGKEYPPHKKDAEVVVRSK